MKRHKTRVVQVGSLAIGGDNPIAVQSMTITDTGNLPATIHQCKRLAEAGCEMIRVSVLNRAQASALGELKKAIHPIPLIADIHFNYNLGLLAIEQGVDKIRLNPGNIGGIEKAAEVIRKAMNKGIPLRIGVNSGSVEQDLLDKYGYPTAEAIVESALRHVENCERLGCKDVIVSLKMTDLEKTVASYRMFAKQTDYPLHVGITEAGMPGYGSIKSAAGIGALLLDGIGDTIRVSLTGDPVLEIPVAYDILKCTRRRVKSPEIIACPSCGRIQMDLEKVVRSVERQIEGIKKPLRISILGCAVNGPGEAMEADIGIAGGKEGGFLFRNGKEVARVNGEDELVRVLVEEIRKADAEGEVVGKNSTDFAVQAHAV